MTYKLVKEVVANINNTIQQTAIGATRSMIANVFGVKVKNFPKNQRVSGTVVVANQKKVEKKLSEGHLIQKSVLDWLKAFKLPTSIKVDNFPKFPEFPKFPDVF